MSKRRGNFEDASSEQGSSKHAKVTDGSISKWILSQVAQDLNISLKQVQNAHNLLNDGNTVAFIARYRKEATNCLDEQQIRNIEKHTEKVVNLETRKKTIVHTITEQGKMTPELNKKVTECSNLTQLEDIYLPYKPKRTSKAAQAKALNLEPLADMLVSGGNGQSPEMLARGFVGGKSGVGSSKEAMDGAKAILIERGTEISEVREMARQMLRKYGNLVSKATSKSKGASKDGKGGSSKGGKKANSMTANAQDPQTYKLYFDFRKHVNSIQSYQVLAINRGEALGFLKVSLDWKYDNLQYRVKDELLGKNQKLQKTYFNLFQEVSQNAVKSIVSAAEREIRSEMKSKAEEDALKSFSKNLRALLLQPPLRQRVVMGIDPGFRNGCKIAVCSDTGAVVDTGIIYPHNDGKSKQNSEEDVTRMVMQNAVQAIAIGNGVASRETERFVNEILSKFKTEDEGRLYGWCIVSECGASVYSASKLAGQELPDLDVSLRGAVSIARRLQDPLAELVKVDPQHLGVGLYQHDIKQNSLSSELKEVVESCVNSVGVELNTASVALLSQVSGLGQVVANAIVEYRDKQGGFKTRQELNYVKGLGPKRFLQCAGFLRVRQSSNALDDTRVHPESYPAACKLVQILDPNRDDHKDQSLTNISSLTSQILQSVGGALKELMGQTERIRSLAVELGVGEPTLLDIVEDLCAPGREVRGNLPQNAFRNKLIGSLKEVKMGMQLQGTVTNTVPFGAFVDVGVENDGLIHISSLKQFANFKNQSCANQSNEEQIQAEDVVSVGNSVLVSASKIDMKKQQLGLDLVELIT